MIKKNLLSWDYYYDKLPLLFKNSYGIGDQLRIFTDFINNCDNVAEVLFKMLDIRDVEMSESDKVPNLDVINGSGTQYSRNSVKPNYVSESNYVSEGNVLNVEYGSGKGRTWNGIELSEKLNSSNNDILDWIGNLIGVKRQFRIKNTYIYLGNVEFIRLIKAHILQNNYEGTREQIDELYKDLGLTIRQYNSVNSGEVDLYWDKNDFMNADGTYKDGFSANDRILFEEGFYTIRSMGLSYNTEITNFKNMGIWDSEGKLWGKTGEDEASTAYWD